MGMTCSFVYHYGTVSDFLLTQRLRRTQEKKKTGQIWQIIAPCHWMINDNCWLNCICAIGLGPIVAPSIHEEPRIWWSIQCNVLNSSVSKHDSQIAGVNFVLFFVCISTEDFDPKLITCLFNPICYGKTIPMEQCKNSQEWFGGLTHGQKKKSSFEWWFQWKITLMMIFSTCVRKLESWMLITITNSNSSPEVNSSEVSLKSLCELCVCTQKHSNHLLGGRAYVTFGLVRICIYIQTRSSREFAF